MKENDYTKLKRMSPKEMKEIQLKIMLVVDDICKKNNIKYTMIGGTLIGAVRHKGFIPWDDDIDIAMMREDYERFIKLFNKENNCLEYQLICNELDRNIENTYAKIIHKNTLLNEKKYNSFHLSYLWVDVFPIDYSDKKFIKLKLKRLSILRSLKNRSLWAKETFKKASFFNKIIYLISRKIGSQFFINRINKISKNRNYKKAQYAGTINAGVGNIKDVMPVEIFENYTYLPFENYKFMAVSKYDEFLKRRFGNYMELPSEQQRVAHNIEAYWRNKV